MPKINPYALCRPEPLVETRTFTDANAPGQELTLTVRIQLEMPFRTAIQERAKKLTVDYVTGRKGGPPAPLQPVKDKTGASRALKLTETVCLGIAYIEGTQQAEDPQDLYSVPELAALSVTMPDAFDAAAKWVMDLVYNLPGDGDESGFSNDEESAPNP